MSPPCAQNNGPSPEPARNNPVGANLNFSEKAPCLNFPHRKIPAHRAITPAAHRHSRKFSQFQPRRTTLNPLNFRRNSRRAPIHAHFPSPLYQIQIARPARLFSHFISHVAPAPHSQCKPQHGQEHQYNRRNKHNALRIPLPRQPVNRRDPLPAVRALLRVLGDAAPALRTEHHGQRIIRIIICVRREIAQIVPARRVIIVAVVPVALIFAGGME